MKREDMEWQNKFAKIHWHTDIQNRYFKTTDQCENSHNPIEKWLKKEIQMDNNTSKCQNIWKMLNISNSQGNTKWIHSEILLHMPKNGENENG